MAPKVLSIMMAYVAAFDYPWDNKDKMFDIKVLRSNVQSNPPEKDLCKEHDPKKQKQIYTFKSKGMSEKKQWRKCINLNKKALKKFYYKMRKRRQSVPSMKLWMRRSDLFSSKVYCENLRYMVNKKLNANTAEERDANTECRWSENWEYQVLDLSAIAPATWECDREAERTFVSFQNKTCSEYDMLTSSNPSGPGLCGGGMPSIHNNDVRLLGKLNRNGESIAKTCCACSERKGKWLSLGDLDNMRTLMENHAKNMNELICSEASDSGTGSQHITQWYWTGSRCRRFAYTGEGGGDNRFETKLECEQWCSDAQRLISL